MKHWTKILFALFITLGLFTSCSDNTEPNPDKIEASALTKKVNLFIKEVMSDIYLWNNQLPNINYKYENDSKEYFYNLLYEEDKWSYITDDIEALENSFEGIEKSFGWSLAFYYLTAEGNEVVAAVEYVYPHTPAANAGIKRGDVIISMNGGAIDDTNYGELLNSDNLSIMLAEKSFDANDKLILSDGPTKNLTSMVLNLNPVVKTNVVEYEGHKIGYMFYAQYLSNYTNAIDTALQSMIDKNVTDLVLDLRYNPGGNINAARHLCSALAPLSVVNDESKLVTFQWNSSYQNYWVSNQIMSQIQVNFTDSIDVKMGLQNIHILTGKGTASASEFTITGLNPYMNVTTVGDTTYGKYTGSITFKPEDWYEGEPDYYEEIANWGLQPIVLRYANAWGVTDFKDGFAPDIPAKDDLFRGVYPLGDMNDPLFAAAIEDITGMAVTASVKSAKIPAVSARRFDRGFSKFDRNKREMLIEFDSKEMNPFH